MPRRYYLSVLIFLVLFITACGGESAGSAASGEQPPLTADLPDRVEIFYIYDEVCLTCEGAEDFLALANQHLGDATYPYLIETINIYESGGMNRFETLAQDLLGVDASTLNLPVMIVNGLAFQGMDAIRGNFNEAILTAGHDLFERGVVFNPRYQRTGDELFADFHADPDNLTLVYFYRIVCPACIEIEPLIQQLPETVEIDGRQVTVDLVRINTRSGNNRDRVFSFFDAFDVPNEYRFVPIIFTASGFYTGPESITRLLEESLAQSENIGLRFP